MKVFSVGYVVQRCLLLRDGCKAFRDASKLQLFSDVYMYKQLQMFKRVLGILEDEGFKKRQMHDLNQVRMSDLLELI